MKINEDGQITHDLIVETRENGDLLVRGEAEAWVLESKVTDGICRHLVQGRDWDDAIAPVTLIATIIATVFDVEIASGTFETDPPEWMGVGWDETPDKLTPIERAVASLEMFSGEASGTRHVVKDVIFQVRPV